MKKTDLLQYYFRVGVVILTGSTGSLGLYLLLGLLSLCGCAFAIAERPTRERLSAERFPRRVELLPAEFGAEKKPGLDVAKM